jgi:formylglycine-generating enzyme required for sulfatase activity
MHGNVWEWCLSRWESSLPGGSITNLVVRAEGGLRVARGGSWLYDGRACRSANRDEYSPLNRCSDVGFRVVLAPAGP